MTKSLKWNQDKAFQYNQAMLWSEKIWFDLPNSPITEIYSNLCSAIIETADTLDMVHVNRTSSGNERNDWFDADCKQSKKQVNSSLKSFRCDADNAELKALFTTAKKSYRNLIRIKKAHSHQSLKQKFCNVSNPSDFWSAVKSTRRKRCPKNPISLQNWHQFFTDIFPPRSTDDTVFEGVLDPILDVRIEYEELSSALRDLKVGKAAGSDLITNEFLTNLPNNWLLYILSLFNKVLEEEVFPPDWSSVLMLMLYKKGDREEPLNYRGIALINSISKLFTRILYNRLLRWIDESKILPECQSGFRAGRGCMDNVYVLQSVIQSHLSRNGSTAYGLFVDFRRAFDSVPHAALWRKLFNLGISAKIVRILKSYYDKASLRVRGSSDNVQITVGVLQGEILSPLLFILYISDMEQFFRSQNLRGLNLDRVTDLIMLLYADDLTILAYSPPDLKRKLRTLFAYCEANFLTVNIEKTKVLPFQMAGRTKQESFYYGNDKLELVSEYNYLGTVISSSSLGRKQSVAAIRKARMAMGSVLSIFSNLKADNFLGITKLYDSIVTSTLLYGAPVWALRYTEDIEIIQMEFFKRVFSLPRSSYNAAVRLEFGLVGLENRVLSLVLGWIVGILKMPPDRFPRKCFLYQLSLRQNMIDSKYNWVAQVDNFLHPLGFGDMWNNLSPRHWAAKKGEILARHKTFLTNLDRVSVSASSVLQHRFPHPPDKIPEYLTSKNSFVMKRTLSQLRLADNNFHFLTYRGMKYAFRPQENCTLCNRQEKDSIYHFLFVCPIFSNLRSHYLQQFLLESPNFNFINILSTNSATCIKSIFYFVANSLLLRAFIMNE